MRKVAIIPARYASSRFPGKPLASICGKPMIQWVYENVSKTKKLDVVYVATDDKRIYDTVKKFGGNVLMTSKNHLCGTDRLAECVQILGLSEDDIVLNIQGDEPLIQPEMINSLVDAFIDSTVVMATLKKEIELEEEIFDSNVVKVITDLNDNAIYFSRYAIPYFRESVRGRVYKHIGMYGYRKEFLLEFSKMKRTSLEEAESLEQLRVIENGYKIKVIETKYRTFGVDIPEHILQIEKEIEKMEMVENGV